MTSTLRFSTGWAPWYVVVVTAFVAFPFVGVALYCFLTPEPWPEAARIAIPIALPALYLTLQVACNRLYVTVTPDGVRVSNGPFPGGLRQNIRRDQITSCYLRRIVDFVDGHEVDRYFLAGVELKGATIQDVSGPIKTAMEAREVAYPIRGILNALPSARSVDIAAVSGTMSPPSGWRLLVVIWILVFILALVLGAYWEIDHSTWHRPPVPTQS